MGTLQSFLGKLKLVEHYGLVQGSTIRAKHLGSCPGMAELIDYGKAVKVQ